MGRREPGPEGGRRTLPLSDLDARVFWQGDPPPLEPDELVTTEANRWNEGDVPAVYLAGDIGLTLVEAGRHLPRLPRGGQTRAIWAFGVRVGGIVDLERREARAALDITTPDWFLDRDRCRAIARSVRAIPGATGMKVPSAGIPDDLGRWNLVLYPDRLREPIAAIIREPAVVGVVRLGGGALT